MPGVLAVTEFAIPFTNTELFNGFVLPGIVGSFVLFCCGWLGRFELVTRYAPAVSWVGGSIVGYAVVGIGPLIPDSYRYWIPHLLILTGVSGVVATAKGVRHTDRLSLSVVTLLVCSWLIVPGWTSLQLTRHWYVVGWMIAILTYSELLRPLTVLSQGSILPATMTAAFVGTAALMAETGSLGFCQVVLTGAGAMAGVTVACRWGKLKSLSGLSLPMSLFVIGMLLIAQINSSSGVPWFVYALLPVAPLSLYLWDIPLLRMESGKLKFTLQLGLPLVTVIAALGIAFASNSGEY